jgi:hypothetical protein
VQGWRQVTERTSGITTTLLFNGRGRICLDPRHRFRRRSTGPPPIARLRRISQRHGGRSRGATNRDARLYGLTVTALITFVQHQASPPTLPPTVLVVAQAPGGQNDVIAHADAEAHRPLSNRSSSRTAACRWNDWRRLRGEAPRTATRCLSADRATATTATLHRSLPYDPIRFLSDRRRCAGSLRAAIEREGARGDPPRPTRECPNSLELRFRRQWRHAGLAAELFVDGGRRIIRFRKGSKRQR